MQVAVMTPVARDGFWDGGWMEKLPLVSRPIVWPIHVCRLCPCLQAVDVLGSLRGEDCEDLGSAVDINVRE